MGSITIKPGKMPPLTSEQIKELEEAAKRPINYDDIPPLTDEQLARMKRVAKNEVKNKVTVA